MKWILSLLLTLCLNAHAEDIVLDLKPLDLRKRAAIEEVAQAPTPVPRKIVVGDEDPPTPEPETPPKITAPKEVSGIGTKADPYIFTTSTRCILELVGKTEGVTWDIEDAPSDTTILLNRYASFSLYEDSTFQIIAYGPGVYSKVWFKIKSGTDPPIPPDPGPNPPDPNPTPKPGKIHVVIVQKQLDLSKAPPAQLLILTGNKLREYCSTHCAMASDGKTPELKIYQKDTDVSSQSPAIQKGFKEAVADMDKAGGNALLWIAVSNGAAGFSGPLPANEEETLKLLKKYGGE